MAAIDACVSFELMQELNLRDSFTTDRHFRQAGFNPLLEKQNR
jgi:predicted nucleic acid-binding protein